MNAHPAAETVPPAVPHPASSHPGSSHPASSHPGSAHPGLPQTRDVRDAAVTAARAGGRPGLVDRLADTRRDPGESAITVQVAGGLPQERHALVTALRRAVSGRVVLIEDDSPSTPGDAVDAVLLVVPATRVIAPIELDWAHALRHRSPRFLLALTGVDQNPSWRHVLETDVVRLRKAGVTVVAPVAVSLEPHRSAADPTASGIDALARRLDDIAEDTAQSALRTARIVARDVPSAVDERKPSPTPRRRDTPRPDRGRWQQVLTDGMAAVSSDVDFDLRTRVRTVVADAEGVVEASDPAKNWDAVDAWLRDRLAYDAEQTFALLARRTAEVAGTLQREIGGPPLRPVIPAAVPDLLGHLPPRSAPTGKRRPLAARGRSLAMSGYGGLMMALVLPRLLGVELPGWLVVGGAVVGAVLLGAAALTGERSRQLDARRNRAKALVRHCADGFLLGASKHTRDVLRGAQQQLRDQCADRTSAARRTDRSPRTTGTDGSCTGRGTRIPAVAFQRVGGSGVPRDNH